MRRAEEEKYIFPKILLSAEAQFGCFELPMEAFANTQKNLSSDKKLLFDGQYFLWLFPFDSRRRFRGYVVDNSANLRHSIRDTCAYLEKVFCIKGKRLSSHAILALDGPKR